MRDPRPATVFDVAERAGVGKSTVSNVLQGKGRVSKRTRSAVLAAARELGYVPNAAARRLRGGRLGTIGIHLPQNPTPSAYYMEFVFGVLEHAAAHERDVTVLTGDRGRLPRVDGLVLSDPMPGDPFTRDLLASGLPVVTCEDVRGGPSRIPVDRGREVSPERFDLTDVDLALWSERRRHAAAQPSEVSGRGSTPGARRHVHPEVARATPIQLRRRRVPQPQRQWPLGHASPLPAGHRPSSVRGRGSRSVPSSSMTTGPQVQVTVRRHRHGGREAVIVRLAGEIDDETSGRVRAAYAEAFAAGLPTVVVDLTGVTLLASLGIADLLLARRSATSTGTELRLVAGENPRVLRPLHLTGVADVLDLCRDLGEALTGAPGARAG